MSLSLCFIILSNPCISKILMTILDVGKDNYTVKSNNLMTILDVGKDNYTVKSNNIIED